MNNLKKITLLTAILTVLGGQTFARSYFDDVEGLSEQQISGLKQLDATHEETDPDIFYEIRRDQLLTPQQHDALAHAKSQSTTGLLLIEPHEIDQLKDLSEDQQRQLKRLSYNKGDQSAVNKLHMSNVLTRDQLSHIQSIRDGKTAGQQVEQQRIVTYVNPEVNYIKP